MEALKTQDHSVAHKIFSLLWVQDFGSWVWGFRGFAVWGLGLFGVHIEFRVYLEAHGTY